MISECIGFERIPPLPCADPEWGKGGLDTTHPRKITKI